MITKYGKKSGGLLFPEKLGRTKYEASLKDVNPAILNDVERDLLTEFDNVSVCMAFPYGYFVHEGEKRIGLCNMNGEVVIPPLEGYVSRLTTEWFFGCKVQDTSIGNYRDENNFTQCVSTQVVVDYKLRTIIPYGKYDDIRVVLATEGLFYLVGQLSENGSMRWGIVDMFGKETVQPLYAGILRQDGKFLGTNDQSLDAEQFGAMMDKELKIRQEEFMATLKAEQAQRRENLINALDAIGNTLMTTAAAIDQAKTGNSASPNVSKGSSQHGGTTRNNDQAWITAKKAYSGYESQLIKMNTYYESQYNDAQRRTIQSNMRQIRQKQEQRGNQMFRSSWEEWDGRKR